MIKIDMALYHHLVSGHYDIQGDNTCYHAIYVLSGEIEISGNRYSAGDGCFVHSQAVATGVDAELYHFCVSPTAKENTQPGLQPILRATTTQTPGDAILRLDQVVFPPKARAYRHIHPGPGIRCLLAGELEIKSDHDTTTLQSGAAWYEDANSPVQATAGNMPETSFIRALILPAAFEGKPTIKLLNPDDEALPRLQTNKRHFDHRIQV